MPGAEVGWRLESESPGRTHGRSRVPTAKLLKENHTLTPFSSLVAARAGCLRSNRPAGLHEYPTSAGPVASSREGTLPPGPEVFGC